MPTAPIPVLAIGVFPGGSSDIPAKQVEHLAFTGLPPGVEVSAALEPGATGTEIQMSVTGVRSGTLCRVFARRRGGGLVPAGSFRYRDGPGDDPATLTTALDLSEIQAVVVRAGAWHYEQSLPQRG